MARKTIIAINNSNSDFTIKDLGSVIVPGSGQLNLSSDFSLIELQKTEDLYSGVNNDTIIINDGSRNLSKDESLQVLSPFYSLDEEIIKNNLNSNRAPTSSDNSSSGYKVGSSWIYNNRVFKLVDEQSSQAVWKSDNIIQNINISAETKTRNVYTTLNKFIYDGSDKTLSSIEIISYMDEDLTSYNIKVVDSLNNSVTIAEKTNLTNTEEEIIDMGTISNLPSGKGKFEIQVKKNDNDRNKAVHLDLAYLKFN